MEIVCINCIDNFFSIVRGVIILGTHINWFCFSWGGVYYNFFNKLTMRFI
jgi:hypothetical protein